MVAKWVQRSHQLDKNKTNIWTICTKPVLCWRILDWDKSPKPHCKCLSTFVYNSWYIYLFFFFNTIFFVSSHMYPENSEGTQVIVGSLNMGYISDTARNRTHNLFRPKREPIPLRHSDRRTIDKYVWRQLKSGNYTSSTAYRHIYNSKQKFKTGFVGRIFETWLPDVRSKDMFDSGVVKGGKHVQL